MMISACAVRDEKSRLDGTHLVLPCSVGTDRERVSTTSLVGANGITLISQTFVRDYNLPLQRLRKPRRLEVVIDGCQSIGGPDKSRILYDFPSRSKDTEKCCPVLLPKSMNTQSF